MLRHIPKILPSELVKKMMDMGHSDYLIIVDANFPAKSLGRSVVEIKGCSTTEVLEAIMQFFPLDDFVEAPVTLMNYRTSENRPEVWEEYRSILEKYDQSNAFKDFEIIDRYEYYKKAEEAYVLVQTTDERRYANISLQKGCC